jgi:ABC-2 type transport system permease protein
VTHLPALVQNFYAQARLFWQLVKLSFQRQFSYRAANLAGLATNFFFGLLRASLMLALYRTRSDVNGVSQQQAVTFTGLSQAVIAYLSLFSWWEVINQIRSGDIASDMLKPMNYFTFWLAQDIGRAIAHLLVRGVTLLVGFSILYNLRFPSTWEQVLAISISLVLGLFVSFAWRFLVNLIAFWIPDARGIGRVSFALTYFLSGFLMPMRFFPGWFVDFCNLTPFPYMVNTVIEVYLGLLTGPGLWHALLLQAVWVIGLFTLCQVVLRSGVRKLVIQGG